MGKSCWKREEAKTKDATEIAVHEVSYEVETGSRLRVIMHGYNSAYILGNTAVCLAAAGLIQRVAAGQAGPQRSLCVFVSVVLTGSTKEGLVKGRRKKKFLEKESG